MLQHSKQMTTPRKYPEIFMEKGVIFGCVWLLMTSLTINRLVIRKLSLYCFTRINLDQVYLHCISLIFQENVQILPYVLPPKPDLVLWDLYIQVSIFRGFYEMRYGWYFQIMLMRLLKGDFLSH